MCLWGLLVKITGPQWIGVRTRVVSGAFMLSASTDLLVPGLPPVATAALVKRLQHPAGIPCRPFLFAGSWTPLRSVISSRLRSLIRAMIITRSTSPEQVYVAAGANGRSRRRELTAASRSWARAWPAAGSRADHTDGDWRPAGYIGEQ